MSLINASDVFCDTRCLQNKEMKEFYDDYKTVKHDLENEINSSKNYYNVSQPGNFNISPTKQKIQDTFNKSIGNIQSKIELYKSNIASSNKNVELYNLYYDKNNELLSDYNDNNTNTLTNDRNSYYENETSTSRSFYNNILKYSYVLTLIIFFIEVSIFTIIFQASAGQRIMGINVVTYPGQLRALPWKILLRTFLICLVLPAVFTTNGRPLHDHFTYTQSVRNI